MRFFAILGMGVLFCGSLPAQAPPEAQQEKVRVGIFDDPPFAMKDENGEWYGMAVDLWEKVNQDLQVPFEYVETPLQDIVPKLARGELDLAIGELAVSAERERLVTFTQPYLFSTAAVALSKDAMRPHWGAFFAEIERHGVLRVILIMAGTLLVFSVLLWLAERGHHAGHFGGKPVHGFGSALWFSAVTMTTVGYGDKTPQTGRGRFLAFLWMFFGILIVSAFTGTVASSITVTRLNAGVQSMADLGRYRNGVLEGSLWHNLLNTIGVPAVAFPSEKAGLSALAAKQITAFVASEVSLRYEVLHDYPGEFQVVPLPTTHIAYAMAMRPGFPLMKELNITLIRETTRPGWQDDVSRWIGPPDASQ